MRDDDTKHHMCIWAWVPQFFHLFFADIRHHAAVWQRSCLFCSSILWSTGQMTPKTPTMTASSCPRWDFCPLSYRRLYHGTPVNSVDHVWAFIITVLQNLIHWCKCSVHRVMLRLSSSLYGWRSAIWRSLSSWACVRWTPCWRDTPHQWVAIHTDLRSAANSDLKSWEILLFIESKIIVHCYQWPAVILCNINACMRVFDRSSSLWMWPQALWGKAWVSPVEWPIQLNILTSPGETIKPHKSTVIQREFIIW